MWMMGYNDGGGEYNTQDSFSTRKLRPLIPRPISSSTTNIPSSTLPSLTRTLRATDFFALNHPMDQSKRELNTGAAVVVSSRWNPTPEQLRTLEELYGRGTRTPSADQIQHITTQLRMYGKIEGKNVFYWFQNHKARERQKRRRQVDVPLPHEPDIHERKESGSSKTSYEGGQTKNWSPSTNCSRLPEEYAPSKQKASAAAESVLASAECSRRPENGWIQFDPDPTTSIIEGNATWQMNPTTSNTPHTNTNPRAKRTTMVDVDPNNSNKKLLKAHELMNIFIASSSCLENGGEADNVVNGYGSTSDSQTLQLFPVRSSINAHRRGEYQTEQNRQTAKPRRQLLVMDEDSSISSRIINNTIEANSNLTSSFQFYEFLPLKN